MKAVAVVAVGAESALGEGAAAYRVGAAGESPTTRIAEDLALREAGLAKPFVARTARSATTLDPAADLLERALRSVATSLDACLPSWRELRVAVVVGTSSGGMIPLMAALRLRARGEPIPPTLARAAPYFGPLGTLASALGVTPCERVQVLAACASSGIAIGLGCRLLGLDHADLVIAGGYDAVSALVAAGFECIGATSATRPSPFRVGRDGMALGEAAALVALASRAVAERVAPVPEARVRYVLGFGASCDAVHVTAPDREGAGLARAALAALRDAGIGAGTVDLVSAHGTATPFNDAAEVNALGRVLGARLPEVVVHPLKAVVGHTLGASSAIELLSAWDAMQHDVLPAAIGQGVVDVPDGTSPVRLLARNEAGTARHCLKLSAAFGGANAALVASVGRGIDESLDGPSLDRSSVAIVVRGKPCSRADVEVLGDRVRLSPIQLSRMDPLSAAAVAATASALEGLPDGNARLWERTGVVVGTAVATLENDEAFDRRLRERGPRAVEPRRFPPTSPNLPPGQCAIAFGLLGPSLAVGAGPEAALEALLVAHDLLAAGDADAMIVVATEDVGEAASDLWTAAGWPLPADGAVAVVLRRSSGAGLHRPDLAALLLEARAAHGRLGAAAPGWPALVEALSRLS